MAHIGFIGVGNMGLGMASNLVKAGHQVSAFDVIASNLDKAVAAGCTAAGSAGDAVDGADAVVTMLPAGKHVREVYSSAVLKWATPQMILIDCSTISVEDARWVSGEAESAGLTVVDAPVSGGVGAAAGGSLTFMVGGSDDGFARAKPILEGMGKAVIHAGGAGAGQAAKICNNMLLAISMIGTCEAFNLADKLGLDRQTFFDIASKASGQCWSMTSYCPVPGPVPSAPSNRNYTGGFATALMLKDLKLAVESAHRAGAAVPLGAQSEALYQLFEAQGGGDTDFSGIIRMLAGRSTESSVS
jgi:3-hydroxyisobutyrate dehydrogenase